MRFKDFAAFGLILSWIGIANAHHPGSHAVREKDGRVRLDVVAMGADACTSIASVRRGVPPHVMPPPGSEPVTVQLARPADAFCATVITTLRLQEFLDISENVRSLHIYVVAPDGMLTATEQIKIQ